MEKLKELNEVNAYVKNIYFGFERLLPTQLKQKKNQDIDSDNLTKKEKSKKKKKSKSKSKLKSKPKTLKKNNSVDEYTQKNENITEDDVNKEETYIEEKKSTKKNSKKKDKKIKEADEILQSNLKSIKQNKYNSTTKKKKKSKNKSKKKTTSKNKSKNKKTENNYDNKENAKISNNKNIIYNNSENEEPQYNEIKDEEMNHIEKHIHDLSLTFMNPKIIKIDNNFSKTYLPGNKLIKTRKLDNKMNTIKINNNINELIKANEQINQRPYTAHGYKVKSKSKKLKKINKNIQEEEKIQAFKEKVYVHDKILSLYNTFNIKNNDEDESKKITSKKNKNQRIKSAYNSKHYMIPKQKDILKQNSKKKKEIEYYNDKYEDDIDEINKNEEEENYIKNKNDKSIKLINSSNKLYGKSQQSISDIKHILNKDRASTFINNFLIKHNFNTKIEESKYNYKKYSMPMIKYYHGGKKHFRPKSSYDKYLKLNKSDNDFIRNKKYKLFNPKEIISNPNNNFNFFNQTFTKEPIYGKYFEPPIIEKSYNNNIDYIPANKWNARYKIKKYINEEKENPNDVYNYDYKYDDLNSDSDNELPNTDFKANKMPKFNKVVFDYKNYKTGKIIKVGNKCRNKKNKINDNYMDKNIFHPFLINDDNINL